MNGANTNKKKKDEPLNSKSSFSCSNSNQQTNFQYSDDMCNYINYFQSLDDEIDYIYEFGGDYTSFIHQEHDYGPPNIDICEAPDEDEESLFSESEMDENKTNNHDLKTIQNMKKMTQQILVNSSKKYTQIQKLDLNSNENTKSLYPLKNETNFSHFQGDNISLQAKPRRKHMLSLKNDEILFKNAFYRACGLSTRCDKKYVQKLYHIVCSSIGLREMNRKEKRSIDLFFKNFSNNSIIIINAVKKCIQENPEIRREIYLSKLNGKT